MQIWTIIGGTATIIVAMFTIFSYYNSSIEKRIDSKLNDPTFLRKVADEVRFPFVIFDEDKSVIVHANTMKHINKIEIYKEERQEVSRIVITPNQYMAIPPVLESLNAQMEFEDPVRGEGFAFVYKRVEMQDVWANTYASGKPPKRRFRLQIIKIP